MDEANNLAGGWLSLRSIWTFVAVRRLRDRQTSLFVRPSSNPGGVGVNGTSGTLTSAVTWPLFRGPAVSCASLTVANLLARNEERTVLRTFISAFFETTRKVCFTVTTRFLTLQSSYYKLFKLVIICLRMQRLVYCPSKQMIFRETRLGPVTSVAGVARANPNKRALTPPGPISGSSQNPEKPWELERRKWNMAAMLSLISLMEYLGHFMAATMAGVDIRTSLLFRTVVCLVALPHLIGWSKVLLKKVKSLRKTDRQRGLRSGINLNSCLSWWARFHMIYASKHLLKGVKSIL